MPPGQSKQPGSLVGQVAPPHQACERTISRRPSDTNIKFKGRRTSQLKSSLAKTPTMEINENPTFCSECKVTYPSTIDASDHIHFAHTRFVNQTFEGIVIDKELHIAQGMLCPLCSEEIPGVEAEIVSQWFFDHIERTHFVCFECQQWFVTEEGLMDHEWGRHRKSGHSCSLCRVEIMLTSGQADESEAHNQARCFYCAEDLAKHWAQFHQKDCYSCQQRFKSTAALRNHVQMSAIHRPTHYECLHCHRHFPILSRLIQHLESSTNPECFVDFNQITSFSDIPSLLRQNALTLKLLPTLSDSDLSNEDSDDYLVSDISTDKKKHTF
ncbi:hypothetical protein DSO57_1001017 [Entomophthora muscae]|uniref:Uncharacterized protein n=1 Tax=Entomophthora muscae TaxID=34485 RepID=A0ACC2UU32_9FUNG|nr:hypothetical protein DSO57_1001017 [Entomophthora muscae]